ncbi:MAG: SDR family oxidoreductase [Kofleriaceae bacterium]
MKTAIVTGASSGVGRAVAERLTAKGWSVTGFARHPAAGTAFPLVEVDVRDPVRVRAAVAAVGEARGTIDLLVNNAAVFRMQRFEEFDVADLDAIVDTNLKGTLYCTHAALAWLKSGSRIVNIGSVAGTHGIANQAVYCASKYGVDGFSEALAQELQPRGIHVTVIAPGGIETPLWQPTTNPYPGPPGKILEVGDVAGLVEYVAELPPHVVFKKAILFPSNEWH